jgi:hypothetical protein
VKQVAESGEAILLVVLRLNAETAKKFDGFFHGAYRKREEQRLSPECASLADEHQECGTIRTICEAANSGERPARNGIPFTVWEQIMLAGAGFRYQPASVVAQKCSP